MAEMALLEITGVSKRFGATAAVDDVSLTIERGAFFALLGPSGCGKTTLLRLIAGFEAPDTGRITIDGVDVTALPPYARPVNMMFQSYALFPHMDVATNIAFGLRQERMDRRHTAARVDEMLSLVQMSGYARRRPHELSGGQRQRINIARALMLRPQFLVLDEPVSALDVSVGAQIVNLLRDLQRDFGLTYLFITHSMPLVRYLATRIAVMRRGKLIEIGASEEICERPREDYTRTLLAATPEMPVVP